MAKQEKRVVWVDLQETEGGAWAVTAEGPRGMGTDALSRSRETAIAVAVRRLAEAEGAEPGICLGCEHALSSDECLTGTVAHLACVEIEER